MVRIMDVAKRANVSTATVSRVLSKPEAVRRETIEKVMEAVQELNYQPNLLARQLRRLETKTILVVVPDITNTFFSKVLRGIEALTLEHGYRVLLGDTDNDVEQELEYLSILQQKQADGLILLTARMEASVIEEMAQQYPIVLACEYVEGAQIPTVSIDNISSARKATEYLIQLGHQRIGCITGPLTIVLGHDRLKGFRQAMAHNECMIDPLLVQEGDFSYESGFNMMTKLLALDAPPTAVFAASDQMAMGAVKAVQAKGLTVPDDISVIGFDDIAFSALFEPSLTTIAQPAYEIGVKAAELLLQLIQQEEIRRDQYILQDELVVRLSTCKCR
ncbi:LacI family DNA-binding transcriptional regulator [Ectobacillus ponti]|uniref:LacI family transcriptional regulator n=1 Tax=Ectobacillus ponti TaxID=2961894 RepID=A0AA41X6C7_9BACI|nr:LacI family DNA-binding transcriptional regulator [Ectobacillus ponti]MCP8969771.1 LacI family transcriptional regulator [Ectobacillus ponti]